PDRNDLVRREPADRRMLADQVLVVGKIDAIDLVAGDVALDPLDACADLVDRAARSLRDVDQLFLREIAGARNLALDDVLRHGCYLLGWDVRGNSIDTTTATERRRTAAAIRRLPIHRFRGWCGPRGFPYPA